MRQIHFGPLLLAHRPGLAYFSLFGYGLHFKDTRRHRLYFSERQGRRGVLKLGRWRISVVRPVARRKRPA